MSKQLFIAAALAMFATSGCIAAEDDASQAETSSVESAVTTSHTIVNAYYNQYLYAGGGANSNLVLTSFVTNAAYWHMNRAGNTGSLPTFTLQNYATNYCIAAPAFGNGLLTMQPCDGRVNEKWNEVLVSIDGVPNVEFKNAISGLCLDTVGGAGSQLTQFPCNDPLGTSVTAQTWRVN